MLEIALESHVYIFVRFYLFSTARIMITS